MKLLAGNMDAIKRLCEQHHVKALFAIGSVTRDELKATSDVDLVVDIESTDPLTYTDNYFGLKFQLEQLFNRDIDLLEWHAIKNKYLKQSIDKSKVLIYGEANERLAIGH